MTHYIASDEQIISALQKIAKNFRTLPSQHKLKQLVEKELGTKKKNFGVTASRLRMLALQSNFVRLEIHSREGDPKKVMTKCPVCGGGLNRVKNLTIWGGEVTIQFRCTHCGYWTGKKKRIPTRYVFHFKRKK